VSDFVQDCVPDAIHRPQRCQLAAHGDALSAVVTAAIADYRSIPSELPVDKAVLVHQLASEVRNLVK
jgi:hypothetical protein